MNGSPRRKTPDHVGRIRLNEEEAQVLYWLLCDERKELLIDRREAKDRGEDIRPFQRQIHHIRKLRDEVSLLIEEKGWSYDQHESFDEEGPDT